MARNEPGRPDFAPPDIGASDEVPGLFGLYVSILSRTARTYFQRELAPFGVGPGQQAYMLALNPGESVSQDVLVRRLSVDKANVTRAVKALEKAKLLEQNTDPDDGRVRLIKLTEKGREVRASVENVSARWLQLLADGIPYSDWKNLELLLGRVAENAWACTGGAS